MPCFFLHVHYGTSIVEDDEGLLVDDLEQARQEAIRGIRSILADEMSQGRLSLEGRIVIMDDTNHVASTVPFREAVEVSD